MDIKRRTFIKLSGLGAAGVVTAAHEGGTTPLAAAEVQANMFDVDIRFIGGFAYVFENNSLVVGAVMSRHHPMHNMELILDKGRIVTNTKLLPNNAGATASPSYIHRWMLNGIKPMMTVKGIPATGIVPPKESNNYVNPASPGAGGDWNDLVYVHQPLKYHKGAQLVGNWSDKMHSRIQFDGGILSIRPPQHSCMRDGTWRGEALSNKAVQHFMKPMATTLQLTGKVNQKLAITIGSETLELASTAANTALELTFLGSSPLGEMVYDHNARQEDQSLFYELIQDSSGNPISPDHQVIPAFESFGGQKGRCTPTNAKIPGEGCSPSFFRK